MTDLLQILPDFPTKTYTHLLPSIEKHLITTTDLLTLDALDIAKRAQLPLLDVRRLVNHVIACLHGELGVSSGISTAHSNISAVGSPEQAPLKQSGESVIRSWAYISTLDPALDALVGGGIPPGYLTEIVGERCHSPSLYLFNG